MTTTIINKNKKSNVPNKQEQNQTCLDSAEREELRPKGNVPNLRFPEFQGEWEKCTLGNNVKIQGGYAFKSELFLRKGIPIIRISNLPQNASFVDLDDCTYYKEGNYNSFEVHNGDLLIAMSGATTGKTAIYNKKTLAYLNQRVGLFKSTNSDSLYYPFLYAFVSTPVFKRQLSTRLIAGAQPNISSSDIESIRISIPQKTSEQEKIAHLMLLLDKRIATQNKIIDKLQSLIKGIMVELQKQGVNKGTWKKVFLSDVLTERNERNTNLFQVFSVSVSQGVVNQVDYLGRSFAAKDTSKYNVVYYGDLVYTKSPTGSFPYGIVKQSINLENVAVSPLYGVYKPKSLAVGAYLHEYFMSEINTHNYLHPLIQKGAKNTINITNQRFLESRVPMPVNSNELLLISKLLYSLNAKIKHVQNTLQEYHKQKQYLLRQMFI